MARIAGIDIPRNKRVVVSLTYIFGIGESTSKSILNSLGIDQDTRVVDLTEEQINEIRSAIDKIPIEGDLRREQAMNIKRLMEIGSRRGIRHRRKLSVRGQRTKTNARTQKGPKKLVSGKAKRA